MHSHFGGQGEDAISTLTAFRERNVCIPMGVDLQLIQLVCMTKTHRSLRAWRLAGRESSESPYGLVHWVGGFLKDESR